MIFSELNLVSDPEPHAGPLNMALDEILLQEALVPTLRCYGWSAPAVSLGYFSSWEEAARRWPGWALVRRWTGGGLVPHGADFTYTLIVPRSCAFFKLPPGETYRLVHEAVAAALEGRWGGVQVAPAAEKKVSNDCFENPAQYDLLARGAKIAGAAQRRTRAGLLHQGSLQLAGLAADFSQPLGQAFSEHVSTLQLELDLLERAKQLAEEKYGSVLWLHKR